MLSPSTCPVSCAVRCDPPRQGRRSATRYRSSWCAPPIYSSLSEGPSRSLPVSTIPLTLKMDGVPTCQVLTFVRHALDSPWVESRVDVLTIAVPIVVGHFRPTICEHPPPAVKSGLYPPRKSLERTGEPFPEVRDAEILGQTRVCTRSVCLQWSMIFRA